MTQEEAKNIFFIKKEIETNKRILKELEEERIYVSSPRLSHAPKGSGGQNSREEKYLDKIRDIEENIKAWEIDLTEKVQEFLEFANQIQDAEARVVFKMRSIECKSWGRIGKELSCDRRTASRKYYKIFEDI